MDRPPRRSVVNIRDRFLGCGPTVHVGRLHVRMPARAELVEAQVVDQDHEQVGALGRGERRHSGSLARPGRRPRARRGGAVIRKNLEARNARKRAVIAEMDSRGS